MYDFDSKFLSFLWSIKFFPLARNLFTLPLEKNVIDPEQTVDTPVNMSNILTSVPLFLTYISVLIFFHNLLSTIITSFFSLSLFSHHLISNIIFYTLIF